MARRHLSAVASQSESDVSPSAVLTLSRVYPGASIGPGALVCSSLLGPGASVGARCVVLGWTRQQKRQHQEREAPRQRTRQHRARQVQH